MGKQSNVVKFLVLTVVVALSAMLAQLLARWSAGAVYIWPPAGFAVAVCLSVSMGRTGWLAVLVGALLAGLAAYPDKNGLILGPTLLASAAALGVVAHFLSREFLKRLKSKSDSDFFVWLLKVGPLACVVPAVITALGFSASSVAAQPALLQNVISWWLANTLGVLLFAPIALIVNRSAQIKLAERQDTRRALIMMGVLLVLLVIGNHALMGLESSRLQRSQQVLMEEVASDKFRSIPDVVTAIDAVKFYVAASQEVTDAEFKEFSGFASRYQAIQSIQLVRSGGTLLEPGLNALMQSADKSGRLEVHPMGDDRLIAIAPVVRKAGNAAEGGPTRAFVVVTLSRSRLLQPLLNAADSRGFRAKVTNISQVDKPVVMASTAGPVRSPMLTETVVFGGQVWQLQMASGNLWRLVQGSGVVLLFRVLSVMVTLGAVVVILGGLSRTVNVLRAIQLRAVELEERLTFQLQAEAALRQQEQDLNVTLQTLGEAVITTDEIGNIVRMNRMAEQLTGWALAQCEGERASAVFCIQNPEASLSQPTALYPVTEALTQKVKVISETPVWMVSRQGQRQQVKYIAAPLLENGKRIRGAVLVFKSVSDEEHLHAKVAADEKRFRSIIERTPTAIATVLGDQIEFINPRMRKLLGVSRVDGEDRILGTSLQQWISQSDFQALSTFRKEDETHHLANELELTLKRYDSEEVKVKVSVGNLDAESQHQFLLFREQGADHQNRFDINGFFSLSPDLICMADSGYLKQVNPAFIQTLGWSQRELLSQPLLSFVHPDDVRATSKEVALLEGGEKVRSFINRCQCKNGNYLWLQWKARIAHRGEVFAIARDITEQMNRIEQLESDNAQLARELRLKEFALTSKGGELKQ
ncbi:PAS domain S-box protein [Limnobacter sp.]|uniref:PAS domain S-box protein n=2 Tax=Limnobacter sp. TaxID=2003368 RepID=UPI002585EC4D|nr:PAS domain S-box protein [Limnobacter sp.]